LDLLKRQTQGFSQFFLAHAEHDAPHADTAADVPVDRVGYFFHECRFSRHASAVVVGSRMPDRFDGVIAPYNAKAARGISAVRIFPEAYVNG
jgi:hypothetical protein